MSGKGKSKLTQSSKSTSSKKMRRKRDISPVRPYSEFPAATSTFSGLADKLMKYGTMKPMLSIVTVSFILLGFSTIIYSSNNTYASSISISLTGNVNLNILKDNTNPTFGKSTTQTATVTSDHFTGYTLTIAGSNDTGRLVGSNDSTRYLSSITTPLTESQFNTDAHNDQWGFLPSKLNSITNNSYQPSPTATTPTTIDVTNSPTTGENYTLALAARVSSNMSLDSYGQTFVLAATGNGYDYHIGFSDVMETLPDDMYGNTQSDTVTLPATTPIKAGYTFAGWCDAKPTVSINGTTCPADAHTYPAGYNSFQLNGDSANNVELYAIWEAVTFAKAFQDAQVTANMQNMTTGICNAVAIGQEATLSDTRGGSYRVGKMKDGKCWMLDNLALGSSTTITLTPDNTNISANYTLPATRTDGFNVYNEPRVNIAHNAIVPQGDDPLKQQALSGNWKVGTYYNYCAASAGSYCPAAGAAAGPVDQDICPKGWRMPSGGPGGEYQVIYDAYGNNYTNFRTALHLPLSGYYSFAQVYNQGSDGHWWSSTFYNGNYMYVLRSTISGIYPQHAINRYYGFSLRCVAK